MVHTGVGEWWVDAWPDPAASLLFVGGNLAATGDVRRIDPGFVAEVVRERLREWDRIFIDVPAVLRVPLGPLQPGSLQPWPLRAARAIAPPSRPAADPRAAIRRLGSADISALSSLDASLRWIGDTWGGLDGLARGGRAWAAWCDGRLAAISAPGFVGDRVEDIFVVTEPPFRGRQLSAACAVRVMEEIAASGNEAGWTTWPDNRASLRVAEKLGFDGWRDHVTWVAGDPL
jgi:RimJ/RimL family protein N-acetyltransferase